MFFHRNEVLAGWSYSVRDWLVVKGSNHVTKTGGLLMVLEAALGQAELLDKNLYRCAAGI